MNIPTTTHNPTPLPVDLPTINASAQESLDLSYQLLLLYLQSSPSASLNSLNTLSAILHKLTTSYAQLHSAFIKSQELALKQQLINLKLPSTSSSKTISPDTLKQIESELNLL